MEQEPLSIDSFVLRFIHPSEEGMERSTRGIVTHVQSAKSLHFTCWDDAVRFIKGFVDIADSPDESQFNDRGDQYEIDK